MVLKIKIEGELLDFLTEEAERNMRSRPQQLLYYVQEKAIESANDYTNVNTKKGTKRGSKWLQRGHNDTQEVLLDSNVLNF